MTNSHDDGNLSCLSGSCAFVSVVFILASVVSSVIFSIKGLIRDWDLVKECDDSNMHIFVIVTLVIALFSGGNAGSKNYSKKKNTSISSFFAPFILSLGMTIWGYLEIFKFSCASLENSLLWGMGIFWTSVYTLSLSVSLCGIFFTICTLK